MADDKTKSEQASSSDQSGNASTGGEEQASNSPFEEAGQVDPSFAETTADEDKAAAEEEAKKTIESGKKSEKTDDPNPEESGKEKEEAPSNEGDSERGKLSSKNVDLSNAGDKLFDQFEEAFSGQDAETLEKVEGLVDSKPKLAQEVARKLFDKMEEGISSGTQEDLQVIADLARTNPKLADLFAQNFYVGEGDDRIQMESLEELFEVLGFESKEATIKTTKPEPVDQEKLTFEVDKRVFPVAREMDMSFEEFQKTPLYKAFCDKAALYAEKGVDIELFWGDVKASVMAEHNANENLKKGAEAQNNVRVAAGISGGEGGDISGEAKLSNADSGFLDTLGVNKDNVRKRIANAKT